MWNQRSRIYLVLNLVGSAVLAVLAWHEEQWGFLLLEADVRRPALDLLSNRLKAGHGESGYGLRRHSRDGV